jgi:hypothetical protein
VGEMERRKALVFVMAIVLVVLAAVTLALTTTASDDSSLSSDPESIAVGQVSSASWAGGSTLPALGRKKRRSYPYGATEAALRGRFRFVGSGLQVGDSGST